MTKTENDSSSAILQHNYDREWPDGSKLRLVYKWYDPSGPFENKPDINRYSLTMTHANGRTVSHSNSFED